MRSLGSFIKAKWAIGLFACICVYFFFFDASTGIRLDGIPSFANVTFRIAFGLRDDQPRSWNGELTLDERQRVTVEPGYFYAEPARDLLGQDAGFQSSQSFDYLSTPISWVCRTRIGPSGLSADEWINRSEQRSPAILQRPSILVHVREGADLPIPVRTDSGNFEFTPEQIKLGQSEEFLGGAVKVTRVPTVTRIAKNPHAHQDFPVIFSAASGDIWVAWQEFRDDADSVCIRRMTEGGWTDVEVLIERADVFHVALSQDSQGRIWVIWADQVQGNWDLYARTFDSGQWSEIIRLTQNPGPDCYHTATTSSDGTLWLVWQKTTGGRSQIMIRNFDGSRWSEARQLSVAEAANGNNWWPVLAAGPDGMVAVAWDGYASGNYDVYARVFADGAWSAVQEIASTPRFEAHPSVAIDAEKRVWFAWDESGQAWGKDTGFLVQEPATQLKESRTIQIVCLDRSGRFIAPAEVSDVLEGDERWELPHLTFDAAGYPVLFVRRLRPRSPDTPRHAPLYGFLWEIWMTRYNGTSWTEPILLPHSTGRNDILPSTTLNQDGRLWAAWGSDQRTTQAWNEIWSEVMITALDFPKNSGSMSLKPHKLLLTSSSTVHEPDEAEDVRRLRSYRIRTKDKIYFIFRGDLHRHTDISADGGHDGSLFDAYRYARDAASLDFLAVTDHTGNVERPYAWWRTQKFADLFQLENFVAFYSYERSVAFPNGHRNIFYTERGHRIVPIPSSEQAGWEGAEQLYSYLHDVNGFSIPHTTARWSGTDWRSHDPSVESLVEIFQGMRDTYEYAGAPKPKRLWSEFLNKSIPIPRAASVPEAESYRPQGFVWKGLKKGHKLGFIASSDHISTHISYAYLIAEELSLKGLLEAVRARRAYAATDNIILDVRYSGSDGDHLMGEIFESRTPVRISARVVGTHRIKQVDIIKDEHFILTLHPDKSEIDFEFVDQVMEPGESYFYVRILQNDGEMAWGSPAWVKYE